MDYHNIFAREQLLALAVDVQVKKRNIEQGKENEDCDIQYGAKKAFDEVIELIYERVEKLQNEQK